VTDEPSLYDAAGGMPFFESLVDRFYDGVASDPGLLAVYPEPDDLSGARHRLTLFLAQYWGGPTTYDRERGTPGFGCATRRSRSAGRAGCWLRHMRDAIASTDPAAERRRAPPRLLRHGGRGHAQPRVRIAAGPNP
jgi:hemoglobin